MPYYWKQSVSNLLTLLAADANAGLTEYEAKNRLKSYGENSLKQRKHYELLKLFLSKFRNPLVLLLLFAGVISVFTEDLLSFVIIVIILLISIILDVAQERSAHVQIEALKQKTSLKSTILREGSNVEYFAHKIVPGDIIFLSSGDIVPADAIILEAKDFSVNQSHLTGESAPVTKYYQPLGSDTPDIMAATNIVFTGSPVVSGVAKVLICNTGFSTELGQMSDSVAKTKSITAFEFKIKEFSILITQITTFSVVLITLINWLLHKPILDSFIFAVAIAVALSPELLPVIMTVTAAHGAKVMAQSKIIVKRFTAMQNIGSIDILCTDKTGTLTEGVAALKTAVDAKWLECKETLKFAYINSVLGRGIKSSLDLSIISGSKDFDISHYKKIDEVTFDFERKTSSILVENNQHKILVTKGNLEQVLSYCDAYKVRNKTYALTDAYKQELIAKSESYYADGYRILAVAVKTLHADSANIRVADETGSTFYGFLLFVDPIKHSTKRAIDDLIHNAGIKIKVLTGDHELVAKRVCEQVGLGISALSGSQIQALDDAELMSKVESVDLFYLMSPVQKSRVIEALKSCGRVVGYIGDGVNDVPALNVADVSIAVNDSVDVAKECASLIMIRKDLNVLYKAVIEGRRTIGNIRKYLILVSSSNFGNMLSMGIASVMLPFLPMLPIQILLNNLLYDLSAITIPFDRVDSNYMQQPRKVDIGTIRKSMFIFGAASSMMDFIAFYIFIFILKTDESLFQTLWFLESISTQILIFFVLRTSRSLLQDLPPLRVTVAVLLTLAVALVLPFLPIAHYVGFVPITGLHAMVLFSVITIDLLIIQAIKVLLIKYSYKLT